MNVGCKTAETCTGCGACAAICPTNAISIKKTPRGFLLPVVNSDSCTECGLCAKRCPQQCSFSERKPKIYALKHNSDEVRAKSTSGGAFTALSDIILEENGSVYGAAFKKDFSVEHIGATDFETRNKMRGSKYVKSTISADIYRAVKEDLDSGKKVLFSGTPCQIAGLNSFLNKEYPNLITVDLICHGTPSENVWLSFLSGVAKGRKISSVQFRSKENGWHRSTLTLFDERGLPFPHYSGKPFMNIFLKHYAHSPACFNCKYCSYSRVSDITIAYFWGIEKTKPEIDDDKGISLVLINSEKGELFFENILSKVATYESTSEALYQPFLHNPPKRPSDYEDFWNAFLTSKNSSKVITKFSGISTKEKIKDRLRPVLQKIGVLKLVKKFIK